MNRDSELHFGTRWSDGHFEGAVAFRNMRHRFEEVAATRPSEVHEQYYIFAGRRVRFRVVGNQLANHILLPFSHLRTDDRSSYLPQLKIDLWDCNTGDIDQKDRLGSVDLEWTELTLKSANQRFVGQRLPHTFSCLNLDSNHIIGSIAWHDRIFIYERAKPLARPLLEWHNDQGVQIIHTALVARNGGGILFVGKSGSGKSTSALACISSGFDYLSEDYVSLECQDDGNFVGHSIYNSVFLKTTHLARFRTLYSGAIKGRLPQEEKSVVILSQVFPERLKRTVPIRVLALVRVTDAPKTKIRPASKGEALLAIGPSSLLQIPNRDLGVQGFQRLTQLIEKVPCYWLEVGHDLRSVTQCVGILLAQVGH